MGRESETGLFPFPFLYQKVYNVNGKAPRKIKQKVTSTGNLDTEVVLIFFFLEVVLMQIWLVRPQWFCFDSAS